MADAWRDPAPVSALPPPLTGPRFMTQAWRDLAFLHWRVDPALVAPRMPAGTRPDVHDGATYVGLIPFRLLDAAPGRGPAVPYLGSFAETNVRLYSVDRSGRRGVVFASLDASRLAVVLAARVGLGLPYLWSRMRAGRRGDVVVHTAARRWPGPRGAGGRVVVRPGERIAEPDPLAHFLTARWGLHVRHLGRTLYVPNRHEAWPLHGAEVRQLDDSLLAAAGFPDLVGRPPDSVLWSPGVRTEFGLPFVVPDAAPDPAAGRPPTAGSLGP